MHLDFFLFFLVIMYICMHVRIDECTIIMVVLKAITVIAAISSLTVREMGRYEVHFRM